MTIRVFVVKLLRLFRVNRVAARIYYKYLHGFSSAGKELPEVVEQAMKKAIDYQTVSQGDYFEFGIFKGHTLYSAQKIAKELRIDSMRFFGFDSFQGLPEVKDVDQTEEEPFYEGQYACSKEDVLEKMDQYGTDWTRTFLIEGFFDQSLNERTRQTYGMKKAAIVLVDCDLYASTVDVLNFVEPMLLDKSILIMDDWNAFGKDDNRGQRRAFAEFLAGNERLKVEKYSEYGSYGHAFIVHKKTEPADRSSHGRPVSQGSRHSEQ